MHFQTTLSKEVRALGTGLHSGKLIKMVMKPAPPNTGVVFCRTDLGGPIVEARPENIDFKALHLATTLRKGEAVVQTTEHLLSALFAMGVDNVSVELDAAEVPIMDGSSAPFLVLLDEAGVRRQAVPRKVLEIVKPFQFERDGKKVWAEPARDLRISYEIAFDHPLIQHQKKTVTVNPRTFEAQVAAARTFGFLRDVSYLKSKGFIRGGSIDNAIVLDGDRILNESLRFPDEFVSHKILDFIGDLALAGAPLRGHFSGYKAGHEMHALFLRELLVAKHCYRIVSEPYQSGSEMALGKPMPIGIV